MKRKLSFVCGALGGIAILHVGAFAETVKSDATTTSRPIISAPVKANGEKKTEKDCEEEWRVNQVAMMQHNMTEESYVEQCSLADDVPPIPQKKTNAAPSRSEER